MKFPKLLLALILMFPSVGRAGDINVWVALLGGGHYVEDSGEGEWLSVATSYFGQVPGNSEWWSASARAGAGVRGCSLSAWALAYREDDDGGVNSGAQSHADVYNTFYLSAPGRGREMARMTVALDRDVVAGVSYGEYTWCTVLASFWLTVNSTSREMFYYQYYRYLDDVTETYRWEPDTTFTVLLNSEIHVNYTLAMASGGTGWIFITEWPPGGLMQAMITAQFRWRGISSLTDMDGNPIAEFTAVDEYGNDWRSVPCICGDLDDDGQVDLGDFGLFALCWELSEPTADCNAQEFSCSDLDNSGQVNLADFAIFALLYGSPAWGEPPDCTDYLP